MASYNSKVHVLGYLGLHAGKCNELAVIISVGRFGTYIIQILINAQLSSNITDKHNSEIVQDSFYTTDRIELIIDNHALTPNACQ